MLTLLTKWCFIWNNAFFVINSAVFFFVADFALKKKRKKNKAFLFLISLFVVSNFTSAPNKKRKSCRNRG